jgi:hypothetical protein
MAEIADSLSCPCILPEDKAFFMAEDAAKKSSRAVAGFPVPGVSKTTVLDVPWTGRLTSRRLPLMRFPNTHILPALSFIFGLCSCAPMEQVKSTVSHDPGRFVNNQDSRQWVAIDDTLWQSLETNGKPSYVPTHPMTQRLQAWADAIRANMIKSSPGIDSAPRPIVRIIQSNEFNAYISSALVCVDADIVIDRPKIASDSLSHLYVSEMSMYPSNKPTECVQKGENIASKVDLVNYALRQQKDCKVTQDGESIVLSADCLGKAASGYSHFKSLSFQTTHNYVTIYSELVKFGTEQEIVGVLAHELGHYYMAHGMSAVDTYDYFYEMQAENSQGKPTPLPPEHPLAQFGQTLVNMPYFAHPVIAGSEFHPYIYSVMSQLRYSIPTEPELCHISAAQCKGPCQPLLDHMAASYDGTLSGFPDIYHRTEAENKAYKQFEGEVKTCFAGLNAATFEPHINRILDTLIERNPIPHLPVSAPNNSVLDILPVISNLIATKTDALIQTEKEGVQKALESGLGWYTYEQEADDIATEMVHRLRLNPKSFIEFIIHAAELNGDTSCRGQFEAGFPQPISMGTFTDPHHDYCFRAYNSYKELKVHHEHFADYTDSHTPVIQPELSWPDAVKALERLQ